MNESEINYYVEPVEIEIYLKKAGKVRTIVKDLKIELIDVEPMNENSRRIFSHFIDLGEPIDLMEVMNTFPESITTIYDSYYQHITLFETLSMHFKSGLGGSIDSWRLSLYFTELLMKYEPTIASSKHIGDFQTYNLNYLIRKLNGLDQKFSLEDTTVAYLIKRRRLAYRDRRPDRVFEKLVELWEHNIKKERF
jgi:hypothetical protein